MSPAEFLRLVEKGPLPPACLFLGDEPYRRQLCRRALVSRIAADADPEQAVAIFDLRQVGWARIVEDASSLTLFAPKRLIWVQEAEAVLPRGKESSTNGEEETPPSSAPPSLNPLLVYLKGPTPGVVIVADASRYDLQGEDKVKAERLRKLYSAIPVHVDFPRFTPEEARQLAEQLAREAGLSIDSPGLDFLVEATDHDALRIANEIEKLRSYSPHGTPLTAEQLAQLVPDSSTTTALSLIESLVRGRRREALEVIDRLLRQGEYLPLTLSFLASLIRMALAARQMRLSTPQQIQSAFSKPGRPVWPSRARQIYEIARSFSPAQLVTALRQIHNTDRTLRDVRPDDRVVVENLVIHFGSEL